MISRKYALIAAVVVLPGAVGAAVTSWAKTAAVHSRSPAPQPSQLPADGVEEVAILIGGSFCGATNVAEFPEAVSRLRTAMRQRALERGHLFSMVAVALDPEIDSGLKWIKSLGEFDEVVIGRGWLNTVAAQRIWRDPAATAGLPQLILLERRVVSDSVSLELGPERITGRWLGVRSITEAAGAMTDTHARSFR